MRVSDRLTRLRIVIHRAVSLQPAVLAAAVITLGAFNLTFRMGQ